MPFGNTRWAIQQAKASLPSHLVFTACTTPSKAVSEGPTLPNSSWRLKLPQLRPLGSWSGQTCTTSSFSAQCISSSHSAQPGGHWVPRGQINLLPGVRRTWAQRPHLCVCSVAKLCPTFLAPWTAARQASLSFTISQSLVKFTSIELVMLSNRFIQYPGNNSQDISLNLFLESVTTIGNLHTSQEKSACRRRCPCPVQRGQAAAARATHPGKSHAGYCLTHLCAPLVYLQPDPVYGRHTKFCPITD